MRWNVLGMEALLVEFIPDCGINHAGLDVESMRPSLSFDEQRGCGRRSRIRGPDPVPIDVHGPGRCRMLAFPTSKGCRPNKELIMFRKVAFTMYPMTDVSRA